MPTDLPYPVRATERVLTVEGRSVGYTAWTTDDPADDTAPPVLLLHGVTDSAECWDPVARVLAPGRRVVGVDARGHGRTPLGDRPFTIAALADDAAAVLRTITDRPAFVVGHSMGGLVAQELALTRPELVAGVLLEEPAWSAGRPADAAGVPDFLGPLLESFAGVDAAPLEAYGRRANAGWPDDEIGPWARSKTQVDQRLAHVPHDWQGRDWVESLAGLDVAVTVVSGAPSLGSVVDPAAAARAREILGGRLVHVPLAGAGHNPRRDDPSAFLAAVGAALDRL
ncbi:alpha/beta fold hydrolase [Cellulomonas sp. P22]|uniref:alpha/beta fold hydrolase n=1 Tax=Cellulomonas sp. P22 TaxID=3373189 RepID=UPI0037AA051E